MMKNVLLKVLSLFLLFSLVVTPVIAQAPLPASEPPPEFEPQQRPLPEPISPEILDAFQDGIPIDEFLVRHQGPIPNALLDYADKPLVVVVQLESPSLITHVTQGGLSRSGLQQSDYVDQLKQEQAAVLSQITTGRSGIQQIGEGFTKVLNGFMLRLPARELNGIRAIPGVQSVRLAPEHVPSLSNSIPLIGADSVWGLAPSIQGDGIDIAIIDTGIDYTHAVFGGSGNPVDYDSNNPNIVEPGTFPTLKVVGGYDFAGSDYDAGNPDFAEPVPDPDPLDEAGHGTHVASIAAAADTGFGSGVAPNANLYALKIFGRSGSTNLTLQAIEWAMDPNGDDNMDDHVDVINMSLGSDWGPADASDPEYIAVEAANALGVVVVASAGNSGDNTYIVGSPSTIDSAISVAASTTGFVTAPFIAYNDGAEKKMPYTTSDNVFSDAITATLIHANTFPGPDARLCDITGVTEFMYGQIALIERGDCSFEVKINNADALGAVAAIIYNNGPGALGMLTGASTLPAASITQADGLILAGLAPINVTIGPDNNVTTFVSDVPADSLADFSSRGPRGFDSKLKPEITAPGEAIFAAQMGGGATGVSMGGTSMAAPHIAGVAALLKQAHPDWSPLYIKAAMMNASVGLVGDVVPLQGAGRVDALGAVETPVIAYADPRLVSLSWGVIEMVADYSDTQAITLVNVSDSPITLDVSAYFTSDDTGATLTPDVASIELQPGIPQTVDVTLELVFEDIPIDFDVLEEYYGFVEFGVGVARLPFYFVPRPYTERAELEAVTQFEPNLFGYVVMSQTSLRGDLYGYPVTMVSDDDPFVEDSGDLRYVGMDYGWEDATYGDIFIPSFAMWAPTHTNQPYFAEIDLFIDADQDGWDELVNFNYNVGAFDVGQDDNVWIVAQFDFTDEELYMGSPYLIYADYNSGFQEWYLPEAWSLIDDHLFDYSVMSFDWYGTVDYAGLKPFRNQPSLLFDTQVDEGTNELTFIFGVGDLRTYNFNQVEGVMLVDYYGKPGTGQAYYWPLDIYFLNRIPVFLH